MGMLGLVLRLTASLLYHPTEAEATTAGPAHEAGASSTHSHEAGTSSSALGDGSPADEFYDSQTIDSTTAKDVYEHEIEVRERFEKKFVKSAETIQQRDAEIASLKSKLEKAEGEAMAVIRLHGRVSELEAATVARANELVDIGARNANS
ncbi:hypothetical protein Tco_1252071, partial [Tanacetum coccineum]